MLACLRVLRLRKGSAVNRTKVQTRVDLYLFGVRLMFALSISTQMSKGVKIEIPNFEKKRAKNKWLPSFGPTPRVSELCIGMSCRIWYNCTTSTTCRLEARSEFWTGESSNGLTESARREEARIRKLEQALERMFARSLSFKIEQLPTAYRTGIFQLDHVDVCGNRCRTGNNSSYNYKKEIIVQHCLRCHTSHDMRWPRWHDCENSYESTGSDTYVGPNWWWQWRSEQPTHQCP